MLWWCSIDSYFDILKGETIINQTCEQYFKAGDRVKVLRHDKYRGESLIGKLGTIKSSYGGSISVLIDGCINDRSAYGYYYFKINELKKINNSADEIKEENMPKFTNYLNIVSVQTREGRHFYCANFDPNVHLDDLVVFARIDDQSDLAVAVVEKINNHCDSDTYFNCEVVTKVDDSAYQDRLKSRAEAAKLKKQMEARAKQLQDIALYQMLAKDDPDMAALLEQYQNLNHK